MRMAKDGRFSKPGVADWPGLLRRVCPPDFWQGWLGMIERDADPRVRWIPKYIVLAWIFIGWVAESGLGQRFDLARRTLAGLFDRRRRPGGSLQSLTQRTGRLGIEALHRFWLSLRGRIAARLGAGWTWQGWQIFAVDGSRVEAPRTRANQRVLGCAGREKTGPQWWLTTLIHLPSRLIWDWRSGPGGDDERRHLREMIPSLAAGTLLLADAAYVGYDLLMQLLLARVDFLIRCGGNTRLRLDDVELEGVRTIESLGHDALVLLWPANRGWPLALRLLTLKRGGRRMYLLTSIHDGTELSRRQAQRLYDLRWGTELNFRALKQTLERRKVLSRTPDTGEMELIGNVLALAMLQAHAAMWLGRRLARMSFAAWLRVLRRAAESVRAGGGSPSRDSPGGRFRGFRRMLRNAVRDDYVRRRSKQSRDYPRKKRGSPPGPPQLLSLTAKQRELFSCLKLLGVIKDG